MESIQSTIENYKLDISEVEELVKQSKRPNVKFHLERYRDDLKLLIKEEEKKIEKEKEKEQKKEDDKKNEKENEQKKEEKIENNLKPTISDNTQYTPINKYAFDTSSKGFVKLYLTDGFSDIKQLAKENIISQFTKKSFDVKIKNFKGKNFRICISSLNKDIDPDKSYTKQLSYGLLIALAKAKEDDYWDNLEKKKGIFDKNEEEGEDKKEKNDDPSANLMEMMKNMYQNGDPEMKKMIAEAWMKSQSEGASGKMPNPDLKI